MEFKFEKSEQPQLYNVSKLQKVLKPIEEVDEVERKFADQKKGSAEITHVNVKTEDKAVTKGVTKDKILDASLAERRDTTTSGNIT